MSRAIYLGACGFLMCSALTQADPGVAEILQKVGRIYKAASSFELAADVSSSKSASDKREAGHVLFAFRSPNRYRLEMMDRGDSKSIKIIVVHDGATLWMYSSETGEYVSAPSVPAKDDAGGPAAQDPFLMWRYRSAADFIDGAKFLREETIEIGGAKVACYVLTVSLTKDGTRSTYTWWVDQERSHVVRDDGDDSSSIFTTIKLEEPLPDDLFRFEPPPGARKQGK